jgi:hypothetical protein
MNREVVSDEEVNMMVNEYDPTEGHTAEDVYRNLCDLAKSHEILRKRCARRDKLMENIRKEWDIRVRGSTNPYDEGFNAALLLIVELMEGVIKAELPPPTDDGDT